jgi:hypothetical protein
MNAVSICLFVRYEIADEIWYGSVYSLCLLQSENWVCVRPPAHNPLPLYRWLCLRLVLLQGVTSEVCVLVRGAPNHDTGPLSGYEICIVCCVKHTVVHGNRLHCCAHFVTCKTVSKVLNLTSSHGVQPSAWDEGPNLKTDNVMYCLVWPVAFWWMGMDRWWNGDQQGETEELSNSMERSPSWEANNSSAS